jgi:hypothetical protein
MLPLRLHVAIDATDLDGAPFTVERHNEDVWVTAPTHLPELTEEIRVVASKDFGALSADLRERGVDVAANALAEMYVEVSLDELLAAVAARSRATAGS